MKKFLVINTYLDLVTNSSSVVYSSANGVNNIKSAFNEILKYAESGKTFDDVFNVRILPEKLLDLNYFSEFLDDFDESDWEFDSVITQVDYLQLGWKERQAEAKKIRPQFMDNWDNWEGDMSLFESEYGFVSSSYVVTLKDGTATKLGSMLFGLFSHEGSYDG